MPLLFLFSCVSLNHKIDTQINYRKDISIKVDGQNYDGVATLPLRSSYRLEFESSGKIDIFSIKSCHQHDLLKFDKIINGKKVIYTYYPSPFELSQASCPLMINAYEKNNGRHSFGMIDFGRSVYSAIAKVDCNGLSQNIRGVYLCQSSAGLFQQISFKDDSNHATNCPATITKSGLAYTIRLDKGICIYTFKVGSDLFRLTTFGFEKILIY